MVLRFFIVLTFCHDGVWYESCLNVRTIGQLGVYVLNSVTVGFSGSVGITPWRVNQI
jgi:hypothetical protein